MSLAIAIVDDHALVREGLRLIIESQPDMTVVGEASDPAAAFALAANGRPQVMLVDLSLDGSDGIALLRDLSARYPHIRLLAVTMHHHEETVRQVFLAGAAGFVVKGAASQELLTAIRAVAKNQNYVHPVIASTVVVDSMRWLRHSDRLSLREIEVLRHVIAGETAVETGRALGISTHTVRRHLSNMALKVGVRGRVALTRYALEHHLVYPETSATPR
ncbi:MAG: response regulator transcription factor [Candidatus Limnocylindrales bacterium]